MLFDAMIHVCICSLYSCIRKLQKQGRGEKTLGTMCTMFLCPWFENRDNGNDDDDKKDEDGNAHPFPRTFLFL